MTELPRWDGGGRARSGAPRNHAATASVSGRPVRSAMKPPAGTEITDSHSTRLIAEPAAAMLQPRSTSSEGPNEKIMAKPTLKRPQIAPATITASSARGSSRAEAAVVALVAGGG